MYWCLLYVFCGRCRVAGVVDMVGGRGMVVTVALGKVVVGVVVLMWLWRRR